MTSQVTACIDERAKYLDLRTKNTKLREEVNEATKKGSKDYGALTEKVQAIRANSDAIDKQKAAYESCIKKIDPILNKFADKQNAYSDYTASLKDTVTKLVDSL